MIAHENSSLSRRAFVLKLSAYEKTNKIVIARSPESFWDGEAIPKNEIASPSARNDNSEGVAMTARGIAA